MVERCKNPLEDHIIGGLSFKLTDTASYITNRGHCTFHPKGSNTYSAISGTELIKYLISGHDWLDPTTFRIIPGLHNEEGVANTNLRPIGGPWSFFQRLRICVVAH